MPGAAIELLGVRFSWPGQAPLLHIDRLCIERGERVFLTGPSGSGKSTLLGLVGAVVEPSIGDVRILGTSLRTLARSRRDTFRADHIGFIFQAFNLLPYLSVDANVRLALQFSRRRRARSRGEADVGALLSALGLAEADLLSRPARQLSMGQQQRVAAARALLGAPEILIADEPTSSLDADAREDFLHLLMKECDRRGTTVLMVSHDRSLAPLFDRTLELSDLSGRPAVPA